ncbi:MAG: STAS domain-containing protein [Candidatus Acidiferrales bacterium]
MATVLLLAPFLALMPQATLAAVVIVYSIGLIRPKEFREILEIRRTEFIWALTAFAGVILLGTLKGIIVAIVASLVALAAQVADPPVYILGRKPGTNVFRPRSKEHPEDETYPGLLLLRLEGRVFFANAEQIGQKIRLLVSDTQPKVVVLDLSPVFDLEYTALKALSEGEKRHRERGIDTWLVGLNPGVLKMVQRSPLGKYWDASACNSVSSSRLPGTCNRPRATSMAVGSQNRDRRKLGMTPQSRTQSPVHPLPPPSIRLS